MKIESEVLLENLASSRVSITSGLRKAIENSWSFQIQDRVDTSIADKEKDINKLCNNEYQGFIESVQDVIEMGSDVDSLQKVVTDMCREIQITAGPVLEHKQSLNQYYAMRKHIDQSIEQINSCQRVVHIAMYIDACIKQEKLLHAVKALQKMKTELAQQEAPLFTRATTNWINQAFKRIKCQAHDVLAVWFQRTRENSQNVGNSALQKFSASMKSMYDPELNLRMQADQIRQQDAAHRTSRHDAEAIIRPLLRMLQLFSYLDQRHELIALYHRTRVPQLALQAMLPDDPSVITPEKFIEYHEKIFNQIVGEFIVERLVERHTSIFTECQLDGVFDATLKALASVLSRTISSISSWGDLLVLERAAVDAALCLASSLHQYNTSQIVAIFRFGGEQLLQLFQAEISRKFIDSVDRDTLTLLEYSDEKYLEFTASYGLQISPDDIHECVSTEKFPFTEQVVACCACVHDSIASLFEYARYLSCPRWGILIQDTLNAAFGALNGRWHEQIERRADSHISQVVQIAVNAAYLAVSCEKLDQRLDEYAKTLEDVPVGEASQEVNVAISICESKTAFEKTAAQAQDLVCELMLALSLYTLDWSPSLPVENHSSVQDLVSYLTVTFSHMAHLPQAVRESVHFASCTHLREIYIDVLSGHRVNRVNLNGFKSMRKIIQNVEDFVDTCRVPQLNECFVPVKQLVELLCTEDLNSIDSPEQFLRESTKYAQVNLSAVTKILEKVRDTKSSTASEAKEKTFRKKTANMFKHFKGFKG